MRVCSVGVRLLQLVHVDLLLACSSVEQVFVTVGTVRSVTVCVDSVCEGHVVYMRTRMQV